VNLHNKPSLAREGSALLQGLVVCGKCGRRMQIRYTYHDGQATRPVYTCAAGHEFQELLCQRIPGSSIDAAISQLVIATMTPLATEMALCVHAELQAQQDQADRQRQRQVERAQYDVDIARQRQRDHAEVSEAQRQRLNTLSHDFAAVWNDPQTPQRERKRMLAATELR